MNWRRRDHVAPPAPVTPSPVARDPDPVAPSTDGSPGDGTADAPEGGSETGATHPPLRGLPTQDLGEVPSEEPPPPDTAHAVVLAVTNQKGGVGKTTTTVSLGAALAAEGHDVLVVDLDPQGNATTGLGLRVSEGAPSTYRVIVEQMPLEDAAEPTAVRQLHLVPSSLDLAGAEIELVPQFSREHRLRSALDAVRDQYDVVLIDCPPSLGLLTVNALVAADQVLVPIQCEYYALEGLGQLMRTIEMVRSGLNHDLALGGVLMTMFDGRTNLSQQVVDEVRGHFGDLAYSTVIPRTVRLSEAPSYGQPITEFDPTSRGARAYQRLAREVIRRLHLDTSDDTAERLSPLDALLGPAAAATSGPPGSDASVSRTDASGSSQTDDSPPVGSDGRKPGPGTAQAEPGAFREGVPGVDRVDPDGDDSMFHVDHPSTPDQAQGGPSWQR